MSASDPQPSQSRDATDAEVKESAKRMMTKHRQSLERLADQAAVRGLTRYHWKPEHLGPCHFVDGVCDEPLHWFIQAAVADDAVVRLMAEAHSQQQWINRVRDNQAEIDPLRAAVTWLREERDAWLIGEKAMSDSYLQIRGLLNAFDTNHGGENRFQVTEGKLTELLAEVASLRATLAATGKLVEQIRDRSHAAEFRVVPGGDSVVTSGWVDDCLDDLVAALRASSADTETP